MSRRQGTQAPVPQQHTGKLVRFGIPALPLSGLLTLVGLLSRYDIPNPRVDPKATAQAASSTGYFVGQFVGSILGLTLLIFGILALTAYLANTRARGLAQAAMVLALTSIALILSALGVTTYALPVIGRAYLNGQQGAIPIAEAIFSAPAREVFVLVFLLYSAAFILFGVAIWRSGVLRRGAAISLGLHAPLFSSFIRAQPNIGTVIGALLFILGSALIALDVSRKPPAS